MRIVFVLDALFRDVLVEKVKHFLRRFSRGCHAFEVVVLDPFKRMFTSIKVDIEMMALFQHIRRVRLEVFNLTSLEPAIKVSFN